MVLGLPPGEVRLLDAHKGMGTASEFKKLEERCGFSTLWETAFAKFSMSVAPRFRGRRKPS